MKQIVTLVNEFDKFTEKQPEGSVADFCRYYLAVNSSKQEDRSPGTLHQPPDEPLLIKTMGRILTMFTVYQEAALADTQLPFREGFYMLSTLRFIGEVKKTEFINEMMMGYTTGIDALTRLIKEGLVQERNHDTDKRAKLVSITPKGQEVLQSCFPVMTRAARIMLKDMHPEAVRLCISLLSETENNNAARVQKLKGKKFDEMWEEVMGSQ